jgi:hypothetical protein
MKKTEVINYDPWQKLAKTKPLKNVKLAEVLERLEVPEKEADEVKKEMLNRVRKLTKPQG